MVEVEVSTVRHIKRVEMVACCCRCSGGGRYIECYEGGGDVGHMRCLYNVNMVYKRREKKTYQYKKTYLRPKRCRRDISWTLFCSPRCTALVRARGYGGGGRCSHSSVVCLQIFVSKTRKEFKKNIPGARDAASRALVVVLWS
jgi:hypothetical protein